MFKTKVSLIAVLTALTSYTFSQNVVNGLANLPAKKIEIIFHHVKECPDNTQLSFAFIENGLTNYYGIIKQNDTIKYIDNKENVFEIGSISKVLTSTLLADAVLDGDLCLEDDINAFYGFNFKEGSTITFLGLANHTSGLTRLPSNLYLSELPETETTANYNNPYKNYDKTKLEYYLKNELTLDQNQKKEYDYSNLGAGLLGYTLALLQRSTYEELVTEKIFRKYEMPASYSDVNRVGSKLVKGLDSEGGIVPNWEWDALVGAGGIASNAVDLSKFAIAQFDNNNRELALTRIPTIIVNENMKIGLGWHILKFDNNEEFHWHNGGTGGYSSSMAIDINAKKGVIILSNVTSFNSDTENIDSLCFELMHTIK